MNESIGAKLKQARELRRLTLQQVSETTKVRPHYLQALENDDLSAIASVAQARGFLRIYAEFLGLTPADLVPAASPAEVVPSTQQSVSTPVKLNTDLQEVASFDKPARPGLLTNLFNRFKRPVDDKEAASAQTMEAASSEEGPKAPQKDSFVPARVTEVLPEIPVPLAETKPVEIKVETDQYPVEEVTTKSKTAKKTPAKSRKASVRLDENIEVKKKVGE